VSSCEKCWTDSRGVNMPYDLLVKRRDADGRTCTPEQQAGPGADECPVCKRWTLHQHTGQPMCGCPSPQHAEGGSNG
jgi:hypothetical protein